jgi:hypothetical protein
MPVTTESTFQFLWEGARGQRTGQGRVPGRFQAGVSLHSHTMFSEESLDMVPRSTAKVPYLGAAIRRQEAEYNARKGQQFDFSQAYWTPPLAPRQAYRLEEKQIQRQLDLPALVSLTDHDDMRAAVLLRMLNRFSKAPISTEWTIPFGTTFFHLGVHNVPAEKARELGAELARFTREPDPDELGPLLERLNGDPDTLIVLNHPLWDEKGVGADEHKRQLMELLKQHGRLIHALELNGLRSWNENAAVAVLAREIDQPVVSGGDRHGREPNAILNLSRAVAFAGFVEEVRYARRSHVVFMPQYREPLKLRVLQTMVDVVRHYPENTFGRRQWSDRVFYRDPASGNTLPLSVIWPDGGPAIVRQFIRAMQFLGWRGVQQALRLALEEGVGVWSDPEVLA